MSFNDFRWKIPNRLDLLLNLAQTLMSFLTFQTIRLIRDVLSSCPLRKNTPWGCSDFKSEGMGMHNTIILDDTDTETVVLRPCFGKLSKWPLPAWSKMHTVIYKWPRLFEPRYLRTQTESAKSAWGGLPTHLGELWAGILRAFTPGNPPNQWWSWPDRHDILTQNHDLDEFEKSAF